MCADMIKPRLGETLDDIREALSYVDYFFPNFDEACLIHILTLSTCTGESDTRYLVVAKLVDAVKK